MPYAHGGLCPMPTEAYALYRIVPPMRAKKGYIIPKHSAVKRTQSDKNQYFYGIQKSSET